QSATRKQLSRNRQLSCSRHPLPNQLPASNPKRRKNKPKRSKKLARGRVIRKRIKDKSRPLFRISLGQASPLWRRNMIATTHQGRWPTPRLKLILKTSASAFWRYPSQRETTWDSTRASPAS